MPSAEKDARPVGTPRGPLQWACAVCAAPLLGDNHAAAPQDGHAPIRILTRDADLLPTDGRQ